VYVSVEVAVRGIRIRRRALQVASALLLLCAFSGDALAQADRPERFEELHWKDHWHRANHWDYLLTVGGFGVWLLEGVVVPGRHSPAWTGPILWDGPMRDWLRQDTAGNRSTTSTISDVMLAGSLVHNLLFDNLVVALALHQEPDAAWQMTVSAAEAYAIAFALTSWTKAAVGRQRPFQDRCEADPEYSDSCDSPSAYRSFYSGHAASTAVGAGLLCAHHLNMPLYDGKVMDIGTCAVGIGLTLATGLLRVASDKHWATDVGMGHLVGFSAGYFVPTLLYYTDEPAEAGDAAVVPDVSPEHLGVRVIGRM